MLHNWLVTLLSSVCLQGTISALRSHLSSNQRENEASACGLRRECEELTHKVQQLRAKLNSAQAAERARLANHTMYSNNAIKKLQDTIEKVHTFITHSHTAGQLSDVNFKSFYKHNKLNMFYMFNHFISHPQGETLLRMADVSRKLETEREKVLPFYTSSLTAEELSQEQAHATKAMSEELAQVKYTFSQITIVIIVLYLTHHTPAH